jgi:hypothetical protein
MSAAAALVLLAASAAGLYSAVQIGRGLRARRWPVTEGEVTGTALDRHDSLRTTADFQRIAYRYEVAERTYESDRLRFGLFGTSAAVNNPDPNYPAAIGALKAAHPRGSKVLVHYNPADPHESVLYVMPPATTWLTLAVAVVAGAAAVAGLF